jgi:Tfp pilus assembly protein PilN
MAKVINLLPKPIQKTREYELLLKAIQVFVILTFIFYGVAIALQIGAEVILSNSLSKTKADIIAIQKTSSQEESQKAKDAVKAVNAKVLEYKNLSNGVPQWSNFIKQFVALVPPGIKINVVSADINTKKVYVSGLAQTRPDVLNFYHNFSTATDVFTQINFPFDNIVRENQVPFNYTFVIQDKVLKLQP